MTFVQLITTRGQAEHLVNVDTIRTVSVETDPRADERALLVIFVDGSAVHYRAVTERGGLESNPAHQPAAVLLKQFRAYISGPH